MIGLPGKAGPGFAAEGGDEARFYRELEALI
jgi:hypothetical protein